MRHPVRTNRVEYALGLDPTHTNIGPGIRRHRPRKAPAIAVKHRQGPQVDRASRHPPVDDVRQGIQIRAAVMVDNALGISGRSRRVIERNRIPFVCGQLPFIGVVAVGDEGLIVRSTKTLSTGTQCIGNVDDQGLAFQLRQCAFHCRCELGVCDEHLGFAVLKHESNRRRIQTCIECVEDSACHRHAEMRLDHLRRIGGHQRNGVADADAGSRQC